MGVSAAQAWYIIDFGGDKIARLDTACKRWQTSIADELFNFYAVARSSRCQPDSVQAWKRAKSYALFYRRRVVTGIL